MTTYYVFGLGNAGTQAFQFGVEPASPDVFGNSVPFTAAKVSGASWRFDTASGTDTPAVIYFRDGAVSAGQIASVAPNPMNADGSGGLPHFAAAVATLYLKRIVGGVVTGSPITITSTTTTAADPTGQYTVNLGWGVPPVTKSGWLI